MSSKNRKGAPMAVGVGLLALAAVAPFVSWRPVDPASCEATKPTLDGCEELFEQDREVIDQEWVCRQERWQLRTSIPPDSGSIILTRSYDYEVVVDQCGGKAP